MLQNCSQKRPDVFFDLPTHCVIAEVDVEQHLKYEEICECARLNEIVNGIGGRPVIIIRYNPDKIKNKGKEIKIDQATRLTELMKIIKEELVKQHDKFYVKIIQLYYDDDYPEYQYRKEMVITKLVCV